MRKSIRNIFRRKADRSKGNSTPVNHYPYIENHHPYIGDLVTPWEAENAIPFGRALELFDQLADRTDIAFGYPIDGCPARAQLMCRGMQEMGLYPKKAWAIEDTSKRVLMVDMPNGATVYWGWHVAAALPVRLQNGRVQNLVFDPGLFDGPVSLQEWGEKMKALPENLQISHFGAAPYGYRGAYDPWATSDIDRDADSVAKNLMVYYLPRQAKALRIVFETAERQQYCQTAPGALLSHGNTWVSDAVWRPPAQRQSLPFNPAPRRPQPSMSLK